MRSLLALVALLLLCLPARADSGFPFVSANTTNCQVVVSGSHRLTGMTMGNTGAAAWIKFYDLATTPTAGALQGVSPGGAPYVFPIPGATALAGSNVFPAGTLLFLNGIAICATGGAANNDTTALATSQVAGTIFFQ